jgi:hypothetical protein
MNAVNQDTAVEAIAVLMRGELAGMELLERLVHDPAEDTQRWAREIERIEASIFTLMQVAVALGVYTDVAREVVIPQHLLDAYWGIQPRRITMQPVDNADQAPR